MRFDIILKDKDVYPQYYSSLTFPQELREISEKKKRPLDADEQGETTVSSLTKKMKHGGKNGKNFRKKKFKWLS